MNAKRLFTTLPVIAAFAMAAAPAGAATTDTQAAASENWAGYAVGGSDTSGSATDFSSLSGSWVQPTATCTTGTSTKYSAFWIGLGGASGESNGLEQTGTQADCSASGQASYYAWYELVPAAPVKLPITVHPGDHMSAKVSVNGEAVTITLSDTTTGQTITKNLTTSSIDTSSAEWIAEAPSECDSQNDCQPLSLANFGSVTFTGASATAGGHTGTIGDSDWSAQPVELSPAASTSDVPSGLLGAAGMQSGGSQSSTAGAVPSSLSSDGSSFSVSYKADMSTAAGAGSTGTGYGATGSGYGGTGGYGATSGAGDPYGVSGDGSSTGGDGYGGGSGGGDPYGYGSGSAYGDGGGSAYGYGGGSADGYASGGAYGYGGGAYSGGAATGYGDGVTSADGSSITLIYGS